MTDTLIEAVPLPPDDPADEQVEDFDVFWSAERAKQPKVRIRGVVVPTPNDLPMELVAVLAGATPDQEDRNRALAADLYGEDVMKAWVRAGMGAREFFTVLLWSFNRGTGGKATFARALEMADEAIRKMGEQQGEALGPVENRADRRRKPRKSKKKRGQRSDAAGGSSAPTSAASTG